jgi:putative membrane protein
MMPARFSLLSSAALALMLVGPAVAQQPNRAQPSAQQQSNIARQLSNHDLTFMKEAALGGMTEVALGNLAQQNAKHEDVKDFGARMVQDHGKANDELQAIAQQKNVELPKQLDAKHAQTRDKLARLRGDEFDRAYMREMVQDHDADLKKFRQAAQTLTDPDLKQFVAKTLGVIEQHDKIAHDITQSLTAIGSTRAR